MGMAPSLKIFDYRNVDKADEFEDIPILDVGPYLAGEAGAREALADNWSVTVFPEGTTTDGQSLLPFKTSMMRVLEPPPPGVLVQPVLLDYGALAEWIGWIGDETGVNNGKRVLARRGTFPLRLHFLEPFSPAEFAGRKAIGAEARKRIEGALLHTLDKPLHDFKHDVLPVRYHAPEDAE